MRSNLTEFESAADGLRRNLGLAQEVDVLRAWRSNTKRTHRSDRVIAQFQAAVPGTAELRRFMNAGIVVGLYGALEQYVERLVADAVDTYVGCCNSYEQLPAGVLRNYSVLSSEVLSAMMADRYFGGLSQLQIASGLHRTLTQETPIPFEANVFARHTANFRWELIKTTFVRAGMDVAQVEHSRRLQDAMMEHFPDEARTTYVIDDLAERRNALAHGSGGDDLLSLELLESYVTVVEEFARALYERVATAVLRIMMSVDNGSFTKLGRPDRVYRRHIAGFIDLACDVPEGAVVGVMTSKSVQALIVEEIQSEGVRLTVGVAGSAVGLRLSEEFSSNSRLVLLPDSARSIAR
ncbi:hypothetical protein BH11ACT8_BH11ACT8_07400 [soil metagenome]